MTKFLTLKFKDKCLWPVLDYMWSSQPMTFLENAIWDENNIGRTVKVNILNDRYFNNTITYKYRCFNSGFTSDAFELFSDMDGPADIDFIEPALEM